MVKIRWQNLFFLNAPLCGDIFSDHLYFIVHIYTVDNGAVLCHKGSVIGCNAVLIKYDKCGTLFMYMT